MNITETKQYYLSSDSGLKLNSTYKSNIRFEIPNLVEFNKNILYQTIRISHAEIPYSFYIINDTNNKFIVNNKTLIIENGNYNASTLKDYINGLFTENSINATLFLINSTGKYYIESIGNITIGLSSIYKVLGLSYSTYNGIFSNGKYYIYFDYPCNTSGIRNIFIKTNIMTKNLRVKNNDSNIIKSIPVNVEPYGIIMYDNLSNSESIIRNRETNILNIELLDDDNNYINFNNIDWSICLEIKIIRELKLNNIDLEDFFNNNNNSN